LPNLKKNQAISKKFHSNKAEDCTVHRLNYCHWAFMTLENHGKKSKQNSQPVVNNLLPAAFDKN